MSRKPGQPADYLGQIYDQVLLEQQIGARSAARSIPKSLADSVWEAIIKKLLQKDYKFDAGFFGSLNEFSRKVAYFFHASLQGTALLSRRGRGPAARRRQRPDAGAAGRRPVFHDGAVAARPDGPGRGRQARRLARCRTSRWLSYECAAESRRSACSPGADRAGTSRASSRRRCCTSARGSTQDLMPAKRLGMRTALFAGDKASLQATPEQLKEPASRPDVLLTELSQITEVVIKAERLHANVRLSAAREGVHASRIALRSGRGWTSAGWWPTRKRFAASIRSASRWSSSTPSSTSTATST